MGRRKELSAGLVVQTAPEPWELGSHPLWRAGRHRAIAAVPVQMLLNLFFRAIGLEQEGFNDVGMPAVLGMCGAELSDAGGSSFFMFLEYIR